VQLADEKVLIDKQVWSCPDAEGHIMNASGTMAAEASGAGIDLVISGFKFT
jgi:hypothetical protein